MGVLKTIAYALTATCLTAAPVTSAEDLLNRVTECVGRLSAQTEHSWLFSDQSTDRIEKERAHLLQILDALVTPDTATRTLAARIDAKVAHASLLNQAAFTRDARTAHWAKQRARRALAVCDGLLLPSAPIAPSIQRQIRSDQGVPVNHDTWNASQ